MAFCVGGYFLAVSDSAVISDSGLFTGGYFIRRLPISGLLIFQRFVLAAVCFSAVTVFSGYFLAVSDSAAISDSGLIISGYLASGLFFGGLFFQRLASSGLFFQRLASSG